MVLSIKEVAAKAKVSVGTVSGVINNNAKVSPELKERVLQVLKEFDYQPNVLGQRLRKQKSCTLGVFMPVFGIGHSTTEVFRGIGTVASETFDYDVLFIGPQFGQAKSDYMRLFKRQKIDGAVIMMPMIDDPGVKELEAKGLPAVVIGSLSGKIDSVKSDDIGGMTKILEHLVSLGYKRIGMLANNAPYLDHRERYETYRGFMKKKGLEFREELVNFSESSELGGYEGIQKLLPFKPEAVVSSSDYLAMGAVRALMDAGLRIPEDIAITGYEDTPMHYFLQKLVKPLTTVKYSHFEMGKESIRMLMARIEGKVKDHQVKLLPQELIIRESTTGNELKK